LFKDSSKNKSYVVKRMRKGVKDAKLDYKVLGTTEINGSVVSLVHICLHTGRTHQIRVQFSSRKMPLLGDKKYGGGNYDCSLALWSYKMSFDDPYSGKNQTLTMPPDDVFPWNKFTWSLMTF